jgi:hypothetical protein
MQKLPEMYMSEMSGSQVLSSHYWSEFRCSVLRNMAHLVPQGALRLVDSVALLSIRSALVLVLLTISHSSYLYLLRLPIAL